jgi:hypothetical protein
MGLFLLYGMQQLVGRICSEKEDKGTGGKQQKIKIFWYCCFF